MRRVLLCLAAAICSAQGPTRPVEEFNTKAGKLKITPIRHASLVIEAGGKVLHADPWKEGNYDGIPKADLILITDIHGDHMDVDAIAKVSKPETKILAPPAVRKTITAAWALENGQTGILSPWKIEAIPMYNEKRGPKPGALYHDKGRGNGYVITYGGLRIYIAGDTEGHPEMRALKNIDVAFVPMNLPFTMTPEEAAEAVKAFAPKVVYPYHYRQTDLKLFANALQGAKIDVRLRNWYY